MDLRCSALPEGKDFRKTYSIQAPCERYRAKAEQGPPPTAAVSLPLIPSVTQELQKQHDFESVWASTLPEDGRCLCILQLSVFIYNAWPGVQYYFLRVHRYMHNLPEIPWKQTARSTASGGGGGGTCFVRKSCWHNRQLEFQWFVEKEKKKEAKSVFQYFKNIQIPFGYPSLRQERRQLSYGRRTKPNLSFHKPENNLYSVEIHYGPVCINGMTVFLLSTCHVSLGFSLSEA